ncbi:biotin/lipoyl-binding protein, partial [Achromobacter sp. Marseille-Q0513]|uniref:biotin/lipoyl-binding protein n=1 Tax=Achromobacter sp. Marseille-Q0513 TaxID=2829161 RepID=UPI001B9C9618
MRIPAKKLLPALLVVAVAGAGYLGWRLLGDHGPGAGFVSGNGRIEATEIDVAAKLPGRVQDVLVKEGDFVAAGQPLARMQVDTLQAQRAEAVAQQQRAVPAPGAAAGRPVKEGQVLQAAGARRHGQ